MNLESVDKENYLQHLKVYLAAEDPDGKAVFQDPGEPSRRYDPGALESAWFWATEGTAELPHMIGRPPGGEMRFPGINASRFGLVCFPPHSAGKRRFTAEQANDPNLVPSSHPEPSMHQTNSLDYDVILSGKIDLELPSGEIRTLGPGDSVIMAGVGHAWKNRYDEACILVCVMIGAARPNND